MNGFESKFTGKAEIYDKYRPDYPEEVINFLYEMRIIKERDKIVDIGCGTGIFTNILATRNNEIIGVEPNIDMLRVAKQRLINFKNCMLINASAENTTLYNNSIDCITVAQAFHWFDKKRFNIESQRILKKDGNVVLIWNVTDSDNIINLKIADLNQKLCQKFNNYSNRDSEKTNIYTSFFRDNLCGFEEFKNDLLLDEINFIGRCLSRSYAPTLQDSNYNEYVYQLKKIFSQYSEEDKIKVINKTRCYYGKV